MAGEDEARARHISGSTTGTIVGYVRSVAGEDGVTRMLELAGETRSVAELCDAASWNTYDQATALFEAAATVTGDPLVGRRAGENLLRQYAGTEVAALLRSLGSPGAVLTHVAEAGAKYSTVTHMQALEVGDGEAVVEAKTIAPIVRHRAFCHYTMGVLSQAAPLFGLDGADVDEVECQTKGDRRCLYVVRWAAEVSADDPQARDRQVEYLRHQLTLLTTRVENLQATATVLVSATSVDDILSEVTARAGIAVRAPKFLLAVRVGDRDELRVHSAGFDSEADADRAAAQLVDRTSTPSASTLLVPVETARRSFGVLAAIYPDGYRFFPQERELLAAYASHAAAALETAEALEEARRQNTTARALFRLAQAVAQVSTREDLAAAVVSAGRTVAEADVASVLLWDEDDGGLRIMAMENFSNASAAMIDGLVIRPGDTPALQQMLLSPAPLLFDTTTDDPFLKSLLIVAQVEQAAVVPLVARNELLGIVSVGFREATDVTADLVERLGGIADCASPAAETVRLLEVMRHQATHDPLTGLVNARGLGDRATAVFDSTASAPVAAAVLFVDLDRFKPVNDTYGHDAGDQVLRDVARRIRTATRTSDVVARIGGDEFVVLLPTVTDADEAAAVAERVAMAVEGPYSIGAATVRLGGSVGFAMVEDARGMGLGELVRMADAAMYERKLERRLTDSISPR